MTKPIPGECRADVYYWRELMPDPQYKLLIGCLWDEATSGRPIHTLVLQRIENSRVEIEKYYKERMNKMLYGD